MITVQHAKEAICRSYVITVASVARQNLHLGAEQDYGVDGTFRKVELRGTRHHEIGIALDFQAKASVDWTVDGTDIVYDLETKSYNDLVERAIQPRSIPFYLILLCLPPDEIDWAVFDAEYLMIKRCAYIARPQGLLVANENSRKRIRIPISNALTPQTLVDLLEGIKSGSIQP